MSPFGATGKAHPVGNGAGAHRWIDPLVAAVEIAGLTIVYPDEPREDQRRLMQAMNVKVAVVGRDRHTRER